MKVREVNEDKKQYISLLLLADEQESMVDRSHKVPNFFADNYDHPIYENGIQLVDMVYLQRRL